MDQYKRYKAEVTIETLSVTTIRKREVASRVDHCDRCGRDIILIGDDTRATAIVVGEPNKIGDPRINSLPESEIRFDSPGVRTPKITNTR